MLAVFSGVESESCGLFVQLVDEIALIENIRDATLLSELEVAVHSDASHDLLTRIVANPDVDSIDIYQNEYGAYA
jgi:hypothetical protein